MYTPCIQHVPSNCSHYCSQWWGGGHWSHFVSKWFRLRWIKLSWPTWNKISSTYPRLKLARQSSNPDSSCLEPPRTEIAKQVCWFASIWRCNIRFVLSQWWQINTPVIMIYIYVFYQIQFHKDNIFIKAYLNKMSIYYFKQAASVLAWQPLPLTHYTSTMYIGILASLNWI